MAKITDVAQLAGVHPSTVSRVLRGDPSQATRPETRRRIFEAARQLKYRPNSLASGLRTRRTDTLALLIPYLDNPGFTEITRGVQTATADAGYLLVLAEVGTPADEVLYARLIHEGRVDGLLVAFGLMEDAVVSGLASEEIPLVLVNRRVEGVPGSVTVDDAEASRIAVDHLVGLGHTRIGHIAGAPDTDTGMRRLQGYREGLLRHGLPVEERWIVPGNYSEEGGDAAVRQLLDGGRGDFPSAIHAADLNSALGALGALDEAGLVVPDDVSVVALNDHRIAAHTKPPLTTVHMPYRRMGEEAVRMLLGAIEGRPVWHSVLDEPAELIVRQSTAPPRRHAAVAERG